MQPTFSIVVPTFRRPERLAGCLAAIGRLDYPRDGLEAIVVDDGGGESLDAALEAAGDVRVTLERQPNAGPACARNLGARRARGRYVAFTDDDCEPAPGWLRALEESLSTGAVAAVGTSTSGAPGNPFATADELVTEFLFRYYNRQDDVRFGMSNNLAVERSAFLAVGGFDEGFPRPGGEDRELVHRLRARGWRLAVSPEATVRHFPSRNLREFCGRHYRYGRGAALYRRRAADVDREDLSFYAQIVRYPRTMGCARLGPLVALSQVATAVGFAHESLASTRHP
ncbi:MAG: glycosyltransferase [Actinomycetota bacterium]|nr:glycosyltransferase [Actinomycetota bacterium]